MEKFLVLKGCAGLGNRLITLMKAIKYCSKTHRTLYVDWADGMFSEYGDNIFYKYFDLKGIKYITDIEILKKKYKAEATTTFPEKMLLSDLENPVIETFDVLTPQISYNTIYKVGMTQIALEKWSYFAGLQSWQRKKYTQNKYWNAIKFRNDGNNFPLGSALTGKHKEDIVFFADFRPLINMKNLLKYISLKPDIQKAIENFANTHDIKNAIGIHVRYTDKKPKSKLERLKKKIDKIIKQNPTQKIFLCTDNNDIINDFKLYYPQNLIIINRFIPESNNMGIHNWAIKHTSKEIKEQMFYESLMDMWLLSMTKTLFWQGNSSFSYISKIIKNDSKNTRNWMSTFFN